jgi:hypothetical protein
VGGPVRTAAPPAAPRPGRLAPLRPARLAARTATWLFLGLNGHLLAEPLDEDTAEHFVNDVVTGKLEIHQIAATLVIFAAQIARWLLARGGRMDRCTSKSWYNGPSSR